MMCILLIQLDLQDKNQFNQINDGSVYTLSLGYYPF